MLMIRLTGQQQIALKEIILAMFPEFSGFEEMLIGLNKNPTELFVYKGSGGENALAVIKSAQQDCWLGALLAALRERAPEDQELASLERKFLPLMPALGFDFFDACCMPGDHLMIDRKRLRASLRTLTGPLGKRVFVVKGAGRCGKSHSIQLMSYLAYVQGLFSVIYIDLEELILAMGSQYEIGPFDFADRLVTKLGYGIELAEPADAAVARWVLKFLDSFEERASADENIRWIIIDGFSKVILGDGTLTLVSGLSWRISQIMTNFRIVLLDYDGELPPSVKFEREEIQPIGETEVTDFFRLAFAQHGVEYDEDTLVASAGKVLMGLDRGSDDFLPLLEQRTIDELAVFAEPGGAR